MWQLHRKAIFHISFAMFLLVTANGCLSSPSQTPTILIETNEPIPSDSFTSSPTSLPTSALASTQLPTLTILPTLSVEEAKTSLLSLSQNNGGCQFPCLWGFTPGQSSIEVLKNSLSRFGQINNPQEFYSEFSWHGNLGGLSFGIWEDGQELIGEFGHIGITEIDTLTLHIVGPRPASSDLASPLAERFGYYLLPQILSTYGEPTDVIVGPYPSDPDRPNDWQPFNLGIFYPEKGFYVEYILTKQTKGDFFVGCPAQVVEVSTVVWDANESKTLLDIAKLRPAFWGINENNLSEYYRPIEEVLPIMKNEFYEKYKDSVNKDCILVPISSWPYR